MTDRLTQLQICLDQLVEQFNATVNYVNLNSEPGLLDENPKSVINRAAAAPVAGQTQPPGQGQGQNQTGKASPSESNRQSNAPNTGSDTGINRDDAEANFENTINELSTDIILKSRQISLLIDSLPGIGVSPEAQLELIEELAGEYDTVEKERAEKIKQKDELLKWCDSLIIEVANGITEARC
ncbi:RNA polymerase II mediator complex subunit [Scheffersomyces spartinae]|uniref:Mediator of RNA polymerase II transcription subunit 21 n=1 Tax=Scheffersomyces spartinae TaxID=45513 RepID=A0A9P7VC86_9ASCO|nr:RNA polymerase II mediator complex subunit [Scheffersomyces spartinae]KAG7194664.1 RNA polymerase II mediator complex subunit [Scheffersomyces spartinae]